MNGRPVGGAGNSATGIAGEVTEAYVLDFTDTLSLLLFVIL